MEILEVFLRKMYVKQGIQPVKSVFDVYFNA